MASRAAVEAETVTTSTTELMSTGLSLSLYLLLLLAYYLLSFLWLYFACYFILITLFIDIRWPELGCYNWEKAKGTK